MGDIIETKCGVCVTHSLHDAYSFLKSLQHRGRDTASITAISGSRIDVLKYAGEVRRFDLETVIRNFQEINKTDESNKGNAYHTFFGHVRYATSGIDTSDVLKYAHPAVLGGTVIEKGNHVYHIDCDAALVHNGQIDMNNSVLAPYAGGVGFDTELLLRYLKEEGYRRTMQNIQGSYFLAFAEKGKDTIVMRDRHGIMPGVIGRKDKKFVFASEDAALRKNGARVIKDVEPGRVYLIRPNGLDLNYDEVMGGDPRHCFFQGNYIASPESTIDDLAVGTLRRMLGEKLAEIVKPEVDIVTYLPTCPEISAMSYADKRGLPFKEVFYKLNKERSFLGRDKEDRRSSIERNLYIQPIIDGVLAGDYLRGKSIGVVDDSIVRGNNAAYARDLLKVNGVREIHLISYTPKIGIVGSDGVKRGCSFGIDMPPDDSFVVRSEDGTRNRTDEEINQVMGINVHYMPYEAMLEVFERMGMPRNSLCTFCIGGSHPFSA